MKRRPSRAPFLFYASIAATASTSSIQPGRIRRLTTTKVEAGGFAVLI
jgi:hypothetical protein